MDESSSHLCIVSGTLNCSHSNKTESESANTLEKISSLPSEEADIINTEFDLAEIEQVLPDLTREISPECDAHPIIGGEEGVLISAMKGSRERRGMSVRNVSVTWAPDVYDPPPMMIKYPRRRGKKPYKQTKSGKNKQKVKKGRMVPRKGSLGADYSFKECYEEEEEYGETQLGRYCGRSRFCGRYAGVRVGTTEALRIE